MTEKFAEGRPLGEYRPIGTMGGYSPAPSAEIDVQTYFETRWACRCGRFLAESAIRHTDHRDDSRYYGVRSEVEWDCSRCGTVKGEEWEPQIVTLRAHRFPPESGQR